MIQHPLDTLVIMLGGAVVSIVALRAVGLPSAVAYLLVGVLLGPHGLQWIAHTDDIHQLGEFGVVFLLFTLGLAFTLEEIRKAGATAFVVGVFQVGATIIAAALIGVLLGVPWGAALVAGVGVAMSSTAVVIKELQAMGTLAMPHGRLSSGVLLVQDLVVVPALVLIPLLATIDGVSLDAIAWGTLRGVAVLVAMPLIGFFLLQALFHRLAVGSSPELFTLLALLFVLGAAWVSERAGLSAGLGAFIAGLVLGETEYRRRIETDIRPFRDVLLGLFFLVIGMMVDVDHLLSNLFAVIALSGTLIVLKGALTAAVALAARVPPVTALRSALTLAQGGEFGFALLILAAEERVLPPDLSQMLLAAIALSMLCAPLLIGLSERFSPSAKDALGEPRER